MSEKLQKVLARAGHGSRRELESWIRAGRVRVEGRVAKLGDRVEGTERIDLDGRRVRVEGARAAKVRVLAYHKPEGELCTRHAGEGQSTVFDGLPRLRVGRWVSVGRLDQNTAGLLLFTNDGELAHGLTHPSRGVEREYAVRVLGETDAATLKRLSRGVELEDGLARFERLREAGGRGANRWYHVVVREGRNRLVRRLWESQDLRVSRLIRVRFGPVSLPRSLRKGEWMELDHRTVDALLKLAGAGEEKAGGRARRAGKARYL